EKWVLKEPFLGTSPSGSALFSQRLRRGPENCKTFMRRFDPGPRLQISFNKINCIRWLILSFNGRP
ncbi:MAG TPA: hypothetical protein VMD29_14400, partial [Terracidiphilus sp.]|nr:hypothetical protein [Terracidiphilus sp.]